MATTAEITSVHKASTTALGGNLPYSGMAWQPRHIPDYYIYMFNVSVRTFERVGPRQDVTIKGVVDDDPVVAGMKPNEKYHYVTAYPQPILMPKFDDQSSEIGTLQVDARRYVMDIVNPNNMSFSLDTQIRPEQVLSIGNDLSHSGVFFTIAGRDEPRRCAKCGYYPNKGDRCSRPLSKDGKEVCGSAALFVPPPAEEVRKAIERMERRYKSLLEKARTLELTDKVKLTEEISSNPDFAYAAEYFGEMVSWRKQQTRPETCRNCGEQKQAGRPFHVNKELGFVCIEPTQEGWMAAYRAGVKKIEDVPDEFRWDKKSA